MLQRLESARISEQADQSTENVKFRVIEPPALPLAPSGSAAGGTQRDRPACEHGGRVGLAFLMQQLRPVFSTRDSLRQVTGLPVIRWLSRRDRRGILPLVPSADGSSFGGRC